MHLIYAYGFFSPHSDAQRATAAAPGQHKPAPPAKRKGPGKRVTATSFKKVMICTLELDPPPPSPFSSFPLVWGFQTYKTGQLYTTGGFSICESAQTVRSNNAGHTPTRLPTVTTPHLTVLDQIDRRRRSEADTALRHGR